VCPRIIADEFCVKTDEVSAMVRDARGAQDALKITSSFGDRIEAEPTSRDALSEPFDPASLVGRADVLLARRPFSA